MAQIVKIARQSFLSSEQIIQALGSKNKLADKKIPAKFFNPADAKQRWAGRGKIPASVKSLNDKGQLKSAEIKA
ncbi:MAG: hypothetical protein ACKVOY_06885 [Burkholderiaceae bacterium]